MDVFQIARQDLSLLIDRVQILAADADTQNAWMHPCGWTRSEPFWHAPPEHPCAPIAELAEGLFDVWPSWRESIRPALTAEGEQAIDVLAARLTELDAGAYVDELETLDSQQWADVRSLARQTLEVLTDAQQHK